jgi:hypothetical protein
MMRILRAIKCLLGFHFWHVFTSTEYDKFKSLKVCHFCREVRRATITNSIVDDNKRAVVTDTIKYGNG